MKSLLFVIVLLCSAAINKSVRISIQQGLDNQEKFKPIFEVIESLLQESDEIIEKLKEEKNNNDILCSDLKAANEASEAIKKGKIGRCDKLIDADIEANNKGIEELKRMISTTQGEIDACPQSNGTEGVGNCSSEILAVKREIIDKLNDRINKMNDNNTSLEEEKKMTNELYSKYLLIAKYGEELIGMRETICNNSQTIQSRIDKE